MALRAARRLPGIRFEAPPPLLDEVLPRMDIAVFVGFAASGPVHLPVAVETAAEFEAIFGGAAPLAWDQKRGEIVRAQLAPAVGAFFANGGSRCWIVRVAERPATNFFPIPGVVRLSAAASDGASGAALAPAFARGRSPGSWSDGVRVGAALSPTPIEVHGLAHQADQAHVLATVGSPDALVAGDVLRCELGNRFVLFITVARLDWVPSSPPSDRLHVHVTGRATWFRTTLHPLPAGFSPQAVVYTAPREPAGVNEVFAGTPVPVVNRFTDWTSARAPGLVRLDLLMEIDDAPEPGALVSVDLGAEQLWVSVHDVGVIGEHASGTDRLRILGRPLWWLKSAPDSVPRVTRCERLSLELWTRRDGVSQSRLGDLGLAPAHPRYWARLADDERRYGSGKPGTTPLTADASGLGPAVDPAFPLAGAGPPDAIYLPLDLPLDGTRDDSRLLGASRQPRTALERDGLSSFGAALFLDPALVTPVTASVAGEAEQVRYLGESPRLLRGIHAAIGIDEATIVAVPDATQRGWTRAVLDTPPRPHRSTPVARPQWSTFLACGTRIVKPPAWVARFQQRTPFRFDSGTFTLEWRGQTGQAFELEEAHAVDWSDAATLYSGTESRVSVHGRPRGVSYYRVRALAGGRASNWSRAITVMVGGSQSWRVVDEAGYSVETLLGVHRALLRAAASRGDLFALLSLPEHYRAGDALAHVTHLKDPQAPSLPVHTTGGTRQLLPLDASEARAFSYGALYHPWAYWRESPGESGLARVAPDGGMAGVLAARSLARGAWIAPANEPLRGVLALSPPIERQSMQALLDASVNVIRQESAGFVPVSANTLSDDVELAPINVRRLLSLLRRLALRDGATYVFEPNDDALQRTVQRGFEALMTRMFERGAFAGRTADAAFQVTTSGTINTPQSVDDGRFIVELRVAPSLPMTFLTVRLMQTGDRAVVTEEG